MNKPKTLRTVLNQMVRYIKASPEKRYIFVESGSIVDEQVLALRGVTARSKKGELKARCLVSDIRLTTWKPLPIVTPQRSY